MAIQKREISKQLEDELRSISFSRGENDMDKNEETIPEPQPKPLPPHKRIVTLEYLDKFEKATIASARYEAIKDFSHILSNLSMVLLAISIIICLILYLIDPQMLTSIALLGLLLEAVALLSITLYAISKTATLRQVRDLANSDLSTCIHIIGDPRSEVNNSIPNTNKSPD